MMHPDELKEEEELLIKIRRNQLNKDQDKPPVGVSLSGGGVRSATQSLGAFQALQEKGLDKEFDYMSTVSGGGYFGSFWGRCFVEGDTSLDMQDKKIKYLRNSGNYIAPTGSGDLFRAIAQFLTNWLNIYIINCLFFLMIAMAFRFLPFVSQSFSFEGISLSVYSVIPVFCLLSLAVFSLIKLFSSKSYEKWLTYSLYGIVGGLFIALVDSIGLNMYNKFTMPEVGGIGAISGFVIYLFSVGKDFTKKLPKFLGVTATHATVIVSVLAILGGLSALTHYFAWDLAGNENFTMSFSSESMMVMLGILIGLFVINFLLGKMSHLLNKLSLHDVFHNRLVRGFLGAAVPNRIANGIMYSTNFDEDDIDEFDYRPYENGGPIHIINTTLNETIDGRSNLYQLNRKGSNLAIIPSVGKSLGVRHHCMSLQTDRKHTSHVPIEVPDKSYQVWGDEQVKSERMTIGEYMAISAAAMSTGMGKQTTMLSSIINGLLGVRLGYWWDSGIYRKRSFFNAFSHFFVNQRLFIMELFARYRGTAKRYWHLSDGAHFDNIGLYELIRRKLKFMVAFDHSQDDKYNFESLADLTRTVRADFGAEVRWLENNELSNLVSHKVRHLFGSRNDLKRSGGSMARAYASVLEVTYNDGTKGHILYILPTVTGREPVDVLTYYKKNNDFPQQTTFDQFFDEEQWESYRRLMNYIVQELFKYNETKTPYQWLEDGEISELHDK